jgi:hypothetical protein
VSALYVSHSNVRCIKIQERPTIRWENSNCSFQEHAIRENAITKKRYYSLLYMNSWLVFSFDSKSFISRCSGSSYCRFSVPYMIVFSQENNAGKTFFFIEQIPLNAPENPGLKE